MSWYAKERAEDRIAELAGRGLDLPTFWHECTEVLVSAVPHYKAPCWFTLDPESLLVTSHCGPGVRELPAEWLAHEYYEDDFHSLADVARSTRGLSTIHGATSGHPSRSRGWRLYVQPYGGEQELRLALRTLSGEAWGIMTLYREPGQPAFDADELKLLKRMSTFLADGAQRGLIIGEATAPDRADAPGLVVLDDQWNVESLTPGVGRWLSELPNSDWDAHGKLPPSVLAVAGRALRSAENTELLAR